MRILMIALLLAPPGIAAEPLVSGVPVGKKAGPYSFLVATGKERGQPTCFICEQGDQPTAVVFARSLSEPLGALMLQLDGEMATRVGFKAWLTVLQPKADLDALAKWSAKQGLKTAAVGAFEDLDGPPAYLLNKDADITLMVFVKKTVLVNRNYRAGELTTEVISAMLAESRESLDKK